MNANTTLLVDIERPGLAEPLRLMCGSGFSMLRTDNTGRDIYGFVHEGQEYPLVPFSFTADGRNTLFMTIPPAYEEWFAGLNVNGARIRFASPHGEQPFAFLPEECRSGSGVIGIDDHGVISITMDEIDPSLCAAIRAESEKKRRGPESGHDEDCACGHEHPGHGKHGHVAREAGQEHAARVQISMSDHEFADAIRKRTEGLNLLLRQAAASGLEVDIALTRHTDTEGTAPDHPLLAVRKIARPL